MAANNKPWTQLVRSRKRLDQLIKSSNDNLDFPIRLKHYKDIVWDLEHLVSSIPTPAYKSYVALMTQVGTNAPVPFSILYNDLGDIVWSYSSAGIYHATLTGAFSDSSKVIVFTGAFSEGAVHGRTAVWSLNAPDFIQFQTDNISGNVANTSVPTDGLMGGSNATVFQMSVEIRVYN